jgi:type I restriction enzyme S subunit
MSVHFSTKHWTEGHLQDLVFFQRGFDITQAQQSPGLYPVISSSGVTSYHSEFKASGPGVVIGRKGTLGSIHFTDSDYWPHDTTLWSKDLRGNNPRFVYYYLHTFNFKRFDVGNSNPTLNRNHIHALPVLIPPVGVQYHIADILSAYDDLIENNRRRMALLEEAARQLYREWFVRLRFPGYEHTRIIGGVPEGWRREPLAALCESIDYGYTASADSNEVGPKFLRITDIVSDVIDWASVPYCPIKEDRLSKFRLVEGDIVIARTGATVGYAKRVHKRHPEAVFASYLVRLRLKPEIDNLMVGIFVESIDYKSYVQSRVGGAAQPNANAKVLSSAEILVPPPSIQRIFHGYVESLTDQRELLQFQNQHLRAARDLLLPQLISGEIAV